MQYLSTSLFLLSNLILSINGKITYSEGVITPHDYTGMGAEALKNNPPSCGMPYGELDLSRITAVQHMDKSVDCGTCIKLTNAKDRSKFEYILAVDTGGRGLDVNQDAFEKVFGSRVDPSPAVWEPAPDSFCVGIWSKNPRTPSEPADKKVIQLNLPDQPKPNNPQSLSQATPTTIISPQATDSISTTTIANEPSSSPNPTTTDVDAQPTNATSTATKVTSKSTETTASSNASSVSLERSYLSAATLTIVLSAMFTLA